MRIIDPHIDIPDLYHAFKMPTDSFFSNKHNPPVSLPQLQTSHTQLIGVSLYVDAIEAEPSFFNKTVEHWQFCEQLFGKSKILKQIRSQTDFTILKSDEIGYLYTLEGFECFRNSEDLDYFYDLGVRVFGPTWNTSNNYACGREEQNDSGFTQLGKQLLKQANNHPCYIFDIAHLSEASVKDLDQLYSGPIICSHGNVRSICDVRRNLTDEEIQIIVDRKGVIGLFPLAAAVGDEGTFEEIYAHVDYVASKWGLAYVGFCSDIYPSDHYSFLGNHTDQTIMKYLYDYLSTRMTDDQLDQVFYRNWERVIIGNL